MGQRLDERVERLKKQANERMQTRKLEEIKEVKGEMK